jgi:RNA methyltransferase, TrmH family
MARQFPAPTDSTKAARKSANLTEAQVDTITSRDNKWLKKFRAALQGTGPTESEPIGVEGPKLVEEAVQSGLEVEALLMSDSGERELERILLAARETEAGIPRSRILRTTDKLFAGVAGTESPQGLAALVQPRAWGFDDLLRGRAEANGAFRGDVALVVVMAGVQDPGNVGTIVRSAEAFGATGAVAARGTADPWSPKALRASAGSALRLPLLRGMAMPILLAQLRMAHVRIFAASAKSGGALPEADLREAAAILIGSEGAGLTPEIERSADARISIPMSEAVESLNAGVAASVVLFEAARQRRGIATTDEHR